MSKLIIVVDNDDSVRHYLIRCLEDLDCRIEGFSGSQEAMKCLERHAGE